MTRTMATNSAMMEVLNPSWTGRPLAEAPGLMSVINPLLHLLPCIRLRSEWIDVIRDCDLAQQYAADHVRWLEMRGVDRGRAGRAGRQFSDEFVIVEFHPD